MNEAPPKGLAEVAAEPSRAGDAVVCPACGSTVVGQTTRVPDHEYGVEFVALYACCAGCGSEHQTPMPPPHRLAAWYPEGYHSMQGRGVLGRMRYGVRYKRLRNYLKGSGALLDYGCGDGSFLDYVAERGETRPLVGFEIGPESRVTERRGGQVRVVQGGLEDLLEQAPECALITMNHVIEHLDDPLAVIAALMEHLSEGGFFEGQTPAAGSLEQKIFGHYWSGYHSPRHTVVFSPRGLSALLSRAGLEDVEIVGAFNPAGLAVSLASLPHGESPGLLPRSGVRWFASLAAASALAPIDLASGAPAMIDYVARKPAVSS